MICSQNLEFMICSQNLEFMICSQTQESMQFNKIPHLPSAKAVSGNKGIIISFVKK